VPEPQFTPYRLGVNWGGAVMGAFVGRDTGAADLQALDGERHDPVGWTGIVPPPLGAQEPLRAGIHGFNSASLHFTRG